MCSIKAYPYLYLLIISVFFFNSSQHLSAQNIILPNDKTNFLSTQKASLEDTISIRSKINFPYIIGYNYSPYTNEINNPYFKENKWLKGSLVFNGKSYNIDGLKYDIMIDNLIILFNNNDMSINYIALDENFITEFTLQNSKFRFFNNLKNSSDKKINAGYFEVVYDGKLKFLVRSEKYKTLNDYTLSTQMFLLKDGVIINVNNMGKLTNLLKDKEKLVKDFIINNSLTLNQSNYSAISKILKFYESL